MLCAVAARGSFSEAARSLGLTQPAVSMQMKSLAGELGVRLFRTGPPRLALTSHGAALVGYAERVLELVAEGAAAARRGEAPEAPVRVAASSTPGVNLLPRRLADFRRRSPRIPVRLEVINSEEVEYKVMAGSVDFGVVGGRRTLAALEAEPWCEDELVLIVPSGHRLSGRRRTIRAAELAPETLLLREAGSATRATVEGAFLRSRAPLPGVDVVGSTEAIKSGVQAGLGVGIVSRFAIERERRAGDLVALRLLGLDLRRPLLFVVDPKRVLSEAAESLLDHLRRSRPGARRRRAG